jgi:hypothetical protein
LEAGPVVHVWVTSTALPSGARARLNDTDGVIVVDLDRLALAGAGQGSQGNERQRERPPRSTNFHLVSSSD